MVMIAMMIMKIMIVIKTLIDRKNFLLTKLLSNFGQLSSF